MTSTPCTLLHSVRTVLSVKTVRPGAVELDTHFELAAFGDADGVRHRDLAERQLSTQTRHGITDFRYAVLERRRT